MPVGDLATGVSSGVTSGRSAAMPIDVISLLGMPRPISSRSITAARLADSSLLCSGLPLESV